MTKALPISDESTMSTNAECSLRPKLTSVYIRLFKSYMAFRCKRLYGVCPLCPGKKVSRSSGFVGIWISEPSTARILTSSCFLNLLHLLLNLSITLFNASGFSFVRCWTKAEEVAISGEYPKISSSSCLREFPPIATVHLITSRSGNLRVRVKSFLGSRTISSLSLHTSSIEDNNSFFSFLSFMCTSLQSVFYWLQGPLW